MWDRDFREHLERQTGTLLEHYTLSREKYIEIWEYYKNHMPKCISECNETKKNYSTEPDRDGPQGIYWIGKDPAILFVGREHYGWYGERTWPDDISSICHSPLQFSYYTVESMGRYWEIIKDIIKDVLFPENEYNWLQQLEKVAFTNACKCLSYNKSYLWNLHANCQKHKYISKEILTVNAIINVLFTKDYQMIDKIFDSELEVLYDHDGFSARRYDSQIIIECAHPGRKSLEWREELKRRIKENL